MSVIHIHAYSPWMSTAFIGGKIHHSAQDSIIMSICYIDFARSSRYTQPVLWERKKTLIPWRCWIHSSTTHNYRHGPTIKSLKTFHFSGRHPCVLNKQDSTFLQNADQNANLVLFRIIRIVIVRDFKFPILIWWCPFVSDNNSSCRSHSIVLQLCTAQLSCCMCWAVCW